MEVLGSSVTACVTTEVLASSVVSSLNCVEVWVGISTHVHFNPSYEQKDHNFDFPLCLRGEFCCALRNDALPNFPELCCWCKSSMTVVVANKMHGAGQ